MSHLDPRTFHILRLAQAIREVLRYRGDKAASIDLATQLANSLDQDKMGPWVRDFSQEQERAASLFSQTHEISYKES